MRKLVFSGAALSLMAASTMAGAIDPQPVGASSSQPMAVSDDGGRKVAGVGGIFGCSADGNKQTIGAVAGGVLGGLLGNRIAGRGDRTIGTILGGALGAAAGSAIGCKLQKNDQAKAERAIEQAVLTGKDQQWNSDTGYSGRVEVGSEMTGADLANLKLASGVEPADGYTRVGGAYVSTVNANVRAAPGTNGRVLGQLSSGQRIWVPAQVKGQPWLLVSDQGVGQGYVSAPLLKKATAVASNNGCKLVKQTISSPSGGEETETLQACKGKDGQWAMTRV